MDFYEKITANIGHLEDLAGNWLTAIQYFELAKQVSPNPDALQKQINADKKAHSVAVPSLEMDFQCDLSKEMQSTANVAGYLEGSDPVLKQELIVVGAHYDHLGMGENGSLASRPGREIHNGADDNASGTAGLLELARVFSVHAGALKRSLLFIAFSGEEEGLLGSRYYVNHPSFLWKERSP
jgi:hypothetical protein